MEFRASILAAARKSLAITKIDKGKIDGVVVARECSRLVSLSLTTAKSDWQRDFDVTRGGCICWLGLLRFNIIKGCEDDFVVYLIALILIVRYYFLRK